MQFQPGPVSMTETPQEVCNFGANVRFTPRHFVAPRTENDVLDALRRHRGRRIRCIGRLHSWSEAPEGDDVLLDLRHLDQVEVVRDEGGTWAMLGAGCQIKRALNELERNGLTLPTLGLVSEQTIAGAISTGTHGSGRHSMSHYVAEVRMAVYDPQSGEPVIRVIDAGQELKASRCSLGCLGVILSVKLPARPQYCIEEHLREYRTLDEVLAAEGDYPLQQFFLLPWRWTWLAQHRREVAGPRGVLAPLYRTYWWATIDLSLHALLKLLVNVLRSPALVRFFYRWLVLVFVLRGWRVVDRAADQLVMEHELFRHIEIEIFVRRANLAQAVAKTRGLIEAHAAGGTYHHHYAICIRKVLADDTLISPAAADRSDEPWYAISLISYERPDRRTGFFQFADAVAKSLAELYGGRPHWGKVCPLASDELARLYPRLAEFREIASRIDPGGVFQNTWTALFVRP
jgi:FAD/FMN-containing dehydrogenase